MPPPLALDGLQIAFPEIDVDALPWLGGVAPQLAGFEADAIERLGASTTTVGVRVGEDVHAMKGTDPPAMPARIAGQPRVAGRLPVARDHAVTHLEARRGIGLALLGRSLAYGAHYALEQLGVLAVGEGSLRVPLELFRPHLELLSADHSLFHEEGGHGGKPVLEVGGVEILRLTHALDGVTELVDVVDALDEAGQVHDHHGSFPVRVERRLVPFPLHGSDAVHGGCARMIPRGMEHVKRSAAGQLGRVAERAQLVRDALAMIALDLHRAVLDHAPRAAQALELRGAMLQILRGQAADHRDDLAVASRPIAENAHHAVAGPARLGERRRVAARLGGTHVAFSCRVDGPAVLHVGQCSRAGARGGRSVDSSVYSTGIPHTRGVMMAGAALSDVQKKVLDRIDDEEIVRLASDLIRIPSFTTEETPCAEWIANYLGDQGLSPELQEIEPGRKQTVARLRGTGGGRSIMLNGHIDIDPLASGWTRDPFEPWIADGKIFGHGVFNMKAGVTACILATLALERSAVHLRGDVVLACVAAELNSGVGTIHAIKNGYRTDMAVIPEPYGADTIITKHTGSMDVVVHTLGRATHIGKKEQGSDAIAKMMRAIAAINAMKMTAVHDPDLPGLPRLNVGSVIGGRGRDHNLRGAYTVSDFCTAYVNVRFNTSQSGETVLADFRRTLDALRADDPEFQYEIEFPPELSRGLGRLAKAAVDVPLTEPVFQMVKHHLKTLSGRDPQYLGVRLPQSYAGNDTTHLWQAGIPCCLYGPGGGYTDYREVHTILDDLFLVTRVLALTALEAAA